MRILRLQLHSFGRHRDLDLEFDRCFTVIRGPNEAGKSTVQRAMEMALFKKVTATGAEIDAWRSWGAPEDERASVRIEFVVEDENEDTGEIIVRQGTVEKEFRGQKGRVQVVFDGETITDPARADQVLAALTGIPNEPFFRSTASIRHQELDDLDKDEGALRDRLAASIGGGDKGSSRARKRLDEAIRSLRSRGEKNPGRLKIAEETVAQAQASVRNGEAALARLERDRDVLAAARQDRVDAEAALGESRNMLEAARQAERLRSDAETVKERYDKLAQAADAQQRLEQLQAMPIRPLNELREQIDKLRTYQARVAVHQEELREGLGPEVEQDEKVPPYAIPSLLTAVMVAATVLLIVIGANSSQGLLYIAAVIVLLGACWVGWKAVGMTRIAWGIKKQNSEREKARASRRSRKVSAEEALRVSQGSVKALLKEIGVTDAGEAEALIAGEQGRRQEIEKLRVQVNALLGGVPAEQVAQQRDQAALDLERKRSALEALGPIATDARARERLEAEVRERQSALERARDAEAGAAARVDANPVDAEQVAGEAERLQTWRDQLAALQRRVRIYETTLVYLGEAERQTMRKATRFLEQHIGRDMARLTGGRYRHVRVDDQSLEMHLHAPDKNDWVAASILSKGTIDQIYLAARIGLVRLVTEGRRPPLLLDDPFVTFDDARAARAALLLRELAGDFQVVYLTCSNRYDGLADAVVELPGPVEVEAPAPRSTVVG